MHSFSSSFRTRLTREDSLFGANTFILFFYLADLLTTTTMSEELQTDFEGGDAGASKVYPAQCSSLRKNGHVVIKVSLTVMIVTKMMMVVRRLMIMVLVLVLW